jgi:RNA polymerase sigma-32 factor
MQRKALKQKTLSKRKAEGSPRKKIDGAEVSRTKTVEVLEPEVLESEEDSESASATDPDVDSEIESTLPVSPSEDLPTVLDTDLPTVSSSDPLKAYLSEIRRYPLLEPEEEFRLVARMREKGDREAARRLVSANLRLVAKIAFEYRNIYSNVMDLIQEGNVGLMKAVSKYDPTKGARLGYYASWWIRSYVLKYLLDNFRLVRLGTTQAQKKLFYQLIREKERLEAQGLLAGPKLLAERLEVREKDVVEMQQRLSSSGSEVSLDTPMDASGEGRETHLDQLTDPSELPIDTLAREQLLRVLAEKIPEFEKGLNAREKVILRERVLSDEPRTLQEIADQYGLTRERARQIEARMLEKLKNLLAPSLGED